MPNILEETQQILFTGHKTGFFVSFALFPMLKTERDFVL